MKKTWLATIALSSLMITSSFADSDFGVVNFGSIFEDSQLGQDKQQEIKKLSNDLQNQLKEKHAVYTDLEKKLSDVDYLDTLSPEGEKDLQTQRQQLGQELGQMQMQFQEMMQQQQQKVMQQVFETTANVAKAIAKEKKLKLIVSKDACLYYDDGLDITDHVVSELDKQHAPEKEKK